MQERDDYSEHGPKRRLPSLRLLALIGAILAALCGGALGAVWRMARLFGNIDD